MYTYYATTETCTENKFQLARIDWLFRGPAIILYKTTTSITQNLSSFPSKQQIMCSSHQKTKSSPIWYPPPPKGPQILLVNQPEFCLRFTLLLCFVLFCFVFSISLFNTYRYDEHWTHYMPSPSVGGELVTKNSLYCADWCDDDMPVFYFVVEYHQLLA
jgi:hypothetical protein